MLQQHETLPREKSSIGRSCIVVWTSHVKYDSIVSIPRGLAQASLPQQRAKKSFSRPRGARLSWGSPSRATSAKVALPLVGLVLDEDD